MTGVSMSVHELDKLRICGSCQVALLLFGINKMSLKTYLGQLVLTVVLLPEISA
jgi:hypothetical protein